MTEHVLVADDDVTVCRILRAALRAERFEVDIVHNGIDALRVLESDTSPRLVLLDWQMPGLDGLEVCRRVRAGVSGSQTHVSMISGRQGADDVLRGFEAGVDEFIPKPFDPKLVAARMQVILRRMASEGAQGARGIRALLMREASEGLTGEVVVRSHERVGRVVFHRGRVAWVHLAGASTLTPLMNELGISATAARAVLEDCRKRGLPFLDTLVVSGLIPREVLLDRFRAQLASSLGALLALPSPSAFSLPGQAAFESGFACDLVEVLPRSPSQPDLAVESLRPLSLVPPPPAPPVAGALLEEMTSYEGVVGATVFVVQSGQALQSWGQGGSESMVRKLARIFLLQADEAIDESLLVSDDSYHLARRLGDNHAIYVRLARAQKPNLGLVRLALQQRGAGFVP